MSTLDIRLLGEFAAAYGGAAIPALSAQRLQCLVGYLLLHRDAPVSRQQLAFLFWPDSTEAQARSNLRNLLHTLLQALPSGEQFVETDNQTVQWRHSAPYNLDLDALLTALDSAQTAEDLQRALDLYRGPLLPCCYDDWILPERERLEQRLTNLVQRFLDRWESEGAYREAIPFAQALVRLDPLREDIYRQVMRLYALGGDRAGVARTLKACQAVLARELDVEPSRQTMEAYRQCLAYEPPAPAPLPATLAPPEAPSIAYDREPAHDAEPAAGPFPVPPPATSAPEPTPSERPARPTGLSEALQHPLTEIPLTMASLAGVYLLLYPQVIISAEAAWWILAVTGLAGTGSFAWHYRRSALRAAEERMRGVLRDQRRADQEAQETTFRRLRARLADGFREVRLADGHYVLRDLAYEHEQLQALIARYAETDPLSLSYLPALADEAFRQGLSVLADALELARATSSPHDQRLEAEVRDLEERIHSAGGPGQDGRVRIMQEKLAAGRERLEMIARQRLRLEGMLQQASQCEAALHQTRIEIASLQADNWTVSLSAVLETLQKTIDQAKTVQDELRTFGY